MSSEILFGSKRKSENNMDECSNVSKKSCMVEKCEESPTKENEGLPEMGSHSAPGSPMAMDTLEEQAPSHSTNRIVTLPLVDWRGSSRDDILGISPTCELPDVSPSKYHKVLYEVPIQKGCVPKPRPSSPQDIWESGFVRMPYSKGSIYPVKGSPGKFAPRWPMINDALKKRTNSFHELQETILSYNHVSSWRFTLMRHLFEEEFDEVTTESIMTNIIPGIAELALRLPHLVTQPIPLLRAGTAASISLSQLQIASLLANAFYCTFPRRQSNKGEFASYPDINFNRLFSASQGRSSESDEKLKCILNYFKRVIETTPKGVVTFTRKVLGNEVDWHGSKQLFARLHVTSSGTIEDQGKDMLQVDFANKMIGGGVLSYGCVQEEIRFVICPELIVSRLFTEALSDNEALVISGVEQYNDYTGYSSTFQWTGDYMDHTMFDESSRRCCSVVAIDAFPFSRARKQFEPVYLERELNKAFIGFSNSHKKNGHLMPVATGNWGCGVFGGDAWLKSLIQLMAASEAGRDVAYFTFGNTKLRDELANLQQLLTSHSITVGAVFRALVEYHNNYIPPKGPPVLPLFKFLYAKFTPGSTLPPPIQPTITPAQHFKKSLTGFTGANSQQSVQVTPAVQKPSRGQQILSFFKSVEEEEEMDTDNAAVNIHDADYDHSFPPLRDSTPPDMPNAPSSIKQQEISATASTSSASLDVPQISDHETSEMEINQSDVPGQKKITEYFKPKM